ncbi:hypothetical protein ABZS61_18265 [Streptomyces sp. NPDC005566]|uniref:hypothetical protein n=1 Tax=Streptomyces sp. NPDC005566 TaxID=3156886 RepID=UPI0033BFB7BB
MAVRRPLFQGELIGGGAEFIREKGCGFSTLLVVTGPHRASPWFDGRATCDQILPPNLSGQPVSFMDWLARGSMNPVGR